MSLTIKELADQLAVSKTAIRKHIDDIVSKYIYNQTR
ncbi:hypothetical protein HMPREF9103_00326 [Lentilactobacillus parafarraginis F0439]|uniref:Helix-turn-helix type 11 domain-containing protein n=1 Tax=Lentilactobacillus parafarraginis F0439 TaxID=797515 RepID=G9ZKS8_9LACO|nr:HTH domain-containing protein [Lentilactobacillus parafarraginis]EHM00797.1 hypothetical protein HMPREF9103_00326 [Lentilactobacillus parafarraginis F0439]